MVPLVSALEWAEFVAASVTAFALPLALVSYLVRKRAEIHQSRREAEETQRRFDEAAFDRTYDDYVALLQLQLRYPELDLGEEPLIAPLPLDDRQRVQEAAMFNIFISVFERAHRLYHRSSDRARIIEWKGWEEYLDELLARPNFARLWHRHSGQYDAEFVGRVNRRLADRRRAHTDAVTVERIDADNHAAVDFVVAAGSDPAAYLDTYMPRLPDRDAAQSWLRSMGAHCFLVRVGHEPVGLLVAHPARSPGVPDGFLETNTYVTPVYRGLRVASTAWALAEPMIQPTPRGLAGVVWERNGSAAVRLGRSGYTEAERVFFRAGDRREESGWCRVWLKADLTA